MNRWLPIEPSKHCISNTQAKLVIADPERADMLEPFTKEIAKSAGTVGFLVWEQQEGKGKWAGFDLWTQVVEGQPAVDTHAFLHELPALGPEDNAAICFTSGTCVYYCAVVIVFPARLLTCGLSGLDCPKEYLAPIASF